MTQTSHGHHIPDSPTDDETEVRRVFCLQFGNTRIRLQRNIAWQRNGRQNGDDGDRDDQLNNGEAGLLFTCHGVSPRLNAASISTRRSTPIS